MARNRTHADLLVEEWVKKATDDELNAQSILRHRDGTAGGVCFLSQQMAEKYLKAFLVHREGRYPKVHPTDALWELCVALDPAFAVIKEDAVFLTHFYVPSRYPGDYPDFYGDEPPQ